MSNGFINLNCICVPPFLPPAYFTLSVNIQKFMLSFPLHTAFTLSIQNRVQFCIKFYVLPQISPHILAIFICLKTWHLSHDSSKSLGDHGGVLSNGCPSMPLPITHLLSSSTPLPFTHSLW